MSSILHQILDRADFSPRTKAKYKLVIDRWLAFAGDHPSGWTRDRVQEWYDALLRSGIKTQSANVYVASLRYVSRWYATKANRPELDFALVQTRRGRDIDDGEPHALSPNEVEALLRTCASDSPEDRRDLTLFVVGLETGMRRMSLEAMTFECIYAGKPYPYARVPIKGAGGRGRFDVPLSDLAMLTLHAWFDWLHEHRHKRGHLFTQLRGSTVGRPLSATQLTRLVGDRAKTARIDHVHPHLLRHTFVTTRTLAGLTVFEIASITGHKVPGMGAAAHYIDMGPMIEKARNSTPPWFDALVRELLVSQQGSGRR